MSTKSPANSQTVRVLTLNVWNTEGPPERQKALPGAIAALDPDLISFQEVAHGDGDNQLARLIGGTGLTGVHQQDVWDAPSLGTALASRWAPRNVLGTLLPVPEGVPPCNLLAAIIPLPIGVDLLFLAVKPYWALDGEAYRARAAVAMADVAEALRCPAPTVIAGDFDATTEADSLQFLAGNRVLEGKSARYVNAWDAAGDGGPGHTWTTANPWVQDAVKAGAIEPGHRRRIDHILVNWPTWSNRALAPTVTAVVQDCRVVLDDPPASDHYGVLADIEFTVVEG
jgi:endonuclease/exonuclease/phosphatase family metal-dependent hydrolase